MAAPVTTTAKSAATAAASAVLMPLLLDSSLYVGDLELNVQEGHLIDVFSPVAEVASVRVCRDQNHRSLGYAYVNFKNPTDAANAMNLLNYTPINGKPMRIMLSNRDPSLRISGRGNVFIKNLDASIDNKALHDTFSAFGTVLSCKVAVDVNGRSKGFGFVQFKNEEDAQKAIDGLNGMLLNDKQVSVTYFIRRRERALSSGSNRFTNVYVKNLPVETTDEELRKIFSRHGNVTSAVVMKDQNGDSKCFGFVNFESPDAAAAAVEKLNGISLGDDKVLYVGRAQKKNDREAELRAKFEEERIRRYQKFQGSNLYLKNLDDSINDEKLKEMFSEFGTVTSCKVMVNRQGISNGAGFVAFSNPEEASRALKEMNGKMIGKKPLYVALAQRKEDRRAHLQVLFSQIRAPGGMSHLPGYHLGAPMLGHQQMYAAGQRGPGLLPAQAAGYGYQQPFMPAMQPAGSGPNFMYPYAVQRQPQPGQRMNFRRGGNIPQVQPQQVFHRNPNQAFRYMANGRQGMDPAAVPHDVQHSVPLSVSKLTTALASASLTDRTRMLGEQLYPLVERYEPVHVAKVTGMLLEMDQAEILHLIESSDALKGKVVEAMEILRQPAKARDTVDDEQLGISSTE